jgi:hypothetical protein
MYGNPLQALSLTDFNFLADKIVKMCPNNTVIVTQEEGVVCNQSHFDRVSAFKLEDQYTSNTISSRVSTTLCLNFWNYL